MLKKQLLMWGIISWLLFTVVNLCMSSHIIKLSHNQSPMIDFWKITVISLVLYLLPLIMGLMGYNLGFYILGLVIAIYTIVAVNVISVMLIENTIEMIIKIAMITGSLVVISVNIYWVYLGYAYRKELNEKHYDYLYHKLNYKQKEEK